MLASTDHEAVGVFDLSVREALNARLTERGPDRRDVETAHRRTHRSAPEADLREVTGTLPRVTRTMTYTTCDPF